MLLTGSYEGGNWLAAARKTDFYHLKQSVENILSRFGVANYTTQAVEDTPFSYGVRFVVNNAVVATAGLVSAGVAKQFDIKQDIWYADINWDFVLSVGEYHKIEFEQLPKFPSVRRDVAMVVNRDLAFTVIEQLSYKEAKKLLQEVSLFDVYTGDKIEGGKKSYAVSFTFRHNEKTLTDEEVEKTMSKLMGSFERELGAIIRKQ